MISESYVRELLHRVDVRDAEAFSKAFASQGLFRFGNSPPLVGADLIAEAVTGFFAQIGGLQHELQECWTTTAATFCHGDVTYTRVDGGTLRVPFAIALKGEEGALTDYLIFVDNSALFAT